VCSAETDKCLSLKVVIVNNDDFSCVTLHRCTNENSVNLTSYGCASTDWYFEVCDVC
jgi:hypothetical protein